MNPMLYVLILIIAAIVYFLSSFAFKMIGSAAVKLAKIFKNNITDEKEKMYNE